MFWLLLVLLPVVLISAVRLAVSLLRFVRRHRGQATWGLVQEWIGGELESWAGEGSWWTGESGHSHADAGPEHHPEPSHHADHSHH